MRRRRRLSALIVASAVAVATFAIGGIAMGGSDIKSATTLRFVAKQQQFQSVDAAPKGPSLSDQIFASAALQRNGVDVGSLDLTCSVTHEETASSGARYTCIANVRLSAGEVT